MEEENALALARALAVHGEHRELGEQAAPLPAHLEQLPAFAQRVQAAGLEHSGDAGQASALLLETTRNPNTRRAYQRALAQFFAHNPPRAGDVAAWFSLEPRHLKLTWDAYRAQMAAAGKAPATINQHKAALCALLKVAYGQGWSQTDGRGLFDSDRAEAYSETRGLDLAKFKQLPEAPRRRAPVRESKTASLRTLRDEAILRLLCSNGLRRAEVAKLDVKDFSLPERAILAQRKGKSGQKKKLQIPQRSADAIARYLLAAGHSDDREGPLFRNLTRNPAHSGGRLTVEAIFKLVRASGVQIGAPDLAPHDLRRSAITALALKTNGNLMDVQEFSGHAKIETVRIYVKNAANTQGRMVDLLDEMLNE